MPLVRIDVQTGRTPAELRRLADTVQDVMLDVFAAPPRDRYQIITEHNKGHIIAEDTGLGLVRSDGIVIIQIFQQGRSIEQKVAVYAELAKRLEADCGIRPEDLIVSVMSNKHADWSFGLGQAQFLSGGLWPCHCISVIATAKAICLDKVLTWFTRPNTVLARATVRPISISKLRASEIARRRTEEERAEALLLCERRRRRQPSDRRERSEQSNKARCASTSKGRRAMSSDPQDRPDAKAEALEVLTFGRSGVDIYPLQVGVGLEDVHTFGKYLGGTTANVAVAAARLGRKAAIITGVGDDPFGRYVRRALRELNVDDRYVVTNTEYATPVTFCEIFPPDNFPLWFYRKPTAPDLQVKPSDIDFDAVRATQLMWLSVTGLSEEPSRESHFAVLEARARKQFTVLDLDYRPMFWDTPGHATKQVQRALPQVTVAVGNREECEVAVGESEPEKAADALLAAGVELAIVKQGPKGVLAKTRSEQVESPPLPIRPLNGLGAGDSFGGSLCHGLLAGWPLHKVLQRANAAGAIVASRLECSTAMPTEAEIETLLAGGDPNEHLADSLAVHFAKVSAE